MKLILRLKLVALASVMLLGLGSSAMAAPVKVGVANLSAPPFFAPDASGKFSGWEIDILNAVCSDQKLECVITPTAWEGMMPALTAGQIDVIFSSMSITTARQKVIDFSDRYYNTPGVIAGPKTVIEDSTPEGLAGKTIGVLGSTVHEVYAQKYFTKSTLKTYKTVDEALQDLAAGRIDATLNDQPVLEQFVNSDAGACCDVKGKVQPDIEVYGPGIGAGIRKDDAKLKEQINAGIKNIRASGTYDKITSQYFKSSIYGD